MNACDIVDHWLWRTQSYVDVVIHVLIYVRCSRVRVLFVEGRTDHARVVGARTCLNVSLYLGCSVTHLALTLFEALTLFSQIVLSGGSLANSNSHKYTRSVPPTRG